MRPVVWSGSSLSAWLDCHLRWYFAYVAGEEEDESEAREVGIATHEYAEWALKVAMGGDALYGTEVKEVSAEAAPLMDVFRHEILPTYQEPVLVEAPYQLEIDDIPYSGVIDSVDEQMAVDEELLVPMVIEGREVLDDRSTYRKKYILRDLKTTASKPRPGRYRLQMTGHWLGATDLGYPPNAAQLDWIVRTKHPYYHPELMDPIEEVDVVVLAAALRAAQDGLRAEEYSPTGLGTPACSRCGYRAICGPYQRFVELTDPKRKEVT